MNITANSGLTIQYLTIIHCNINITKNKPFYLVQKPLYFELKYKR